MKRLICIMSIAALVLAGCGGKKDVKVPDEIKTYVSDNKFGIPKEVEDYLYKYYSTTYKQNSGLNITDEQAKENAEKGTLELGKFIAVGETLGIEIKEEYDAYVNDLSARFGTIEEMLKVSGMSEEVFYFSNAAEVYRNKITDRFLEDNNLSADDYFKNNYWRAKHLLLMTEGKDKAEVKKQIDGLYERVKNGEDFDALIKEYNEDPGVESSPEGYVFTTQTMVQEFEDGVKNLEMYGFDVVETSYGYHLIQRLPLDETPELYEKFLAEQKDDIFSHMVNTDDYQKYIDGIIEENNIEIYIEK